MNIFGKRIVLRALEMEDMALLHSWYNDPDLTAGMGDVHFPTSLAMQRQWYEHVKGDEGTVRLAVTLAGASECVGLTGFWGIHWRDRRAENAVLLGERTLHGGGYGREVIATCARYAFEEMGLHRLDATILDTNIASQKVYESCGFVKEGVQREHALRGGKMVNRIFLGLLASDYKVWCEESGYWDEPAVQKEPA